MRSRFQRRTALAAVVACGMTLRSGLAQADNPIVQTNYTADPAPMLYDGRLYLYTSHDEDVTVDNFFTMNDWRLYSTVDMVNWTDHGSPASYQTFSWGRGEAWAPQAIPRNGKFYLYVPLNNNSGSKIGVAVSDDPSGPFSDPLGRALISVNSGNIDPTVFIDDDEQAYLYWGNPKLYYVKLNSDMISYQGNPVEVSLTAAGFGASSSGGGSAYTEGPWFYKRNDFYYLVYPADGVPEKLSHTMSSGPLGPWTFAGDIMAKQSGAGSSFTNHPGVVDYKGKSYLFYHNGALPGGGGYKRSVCVEEFTYGANGKIPTVQMSSEGPEAVATLNPFQQVEAETIAFSAGLKTEKCTDAGAGINVSSISNGDYIKVKNVDVLDGVTSFEARVSASGQNAKIELHLDSQTGTSLGTCDVSGASSWTTKTCTVSGGSGTHDLFLKFTGGSGDLFKFNWWKFDGPTTDPTGGAGGMGGTSGGGASGGAGVGGAGAPSAGAGGMVATTGGSAGGPSDGGRGGTGAGGAAGQLGAGFGGAAGSGAGSAPVAGSGSNTGGSGASPQTGGNSNAGTAPTGAGRGGTGGVAATAGSSPTDDAPPNDEAGCGCRTSPGRAPGLPFAALLPLLLGLRRRARRSARAR